MLRNRACSILTALFLIITEPAVAGAGPEAVEARPQLSAYGIVLSAPKGWQEALSDKGKTIIRWLRRGPGPGGAVQAMILIDVGKTNAAGVDDLAQGMAKNFGGVVLPEATTLGGTRALRVRAAHRGNALRPVEAVVALHSGFAYLLMGGVAPGGTCADEVEAVRRSWRWVDFDSPAKHLEFWTEPQPALGGTIRLNYPVRMHTYPDENSERVLHLGLHNLQRNSPDFMAYVQLGPKPAGLPFSEFQTRSANALNEKNELDEPIAWRARKGPPARALSQVIQVKAPIAEATGPVFIQWALVEVDAERAVYVNFTYPDGKAEDRRPYEAVAERIVDSIKVVEKK